MRQVSGLRKFIGNDAILGVGVVVVVVAMLAVLGVLYLRPPSQKSFTFETTDAAAITTGQDIRVAGISVGKVEKVELEPERVKVTARVDDTTRIGDQSRVEVRMLTPVGGYAITLIPMGTTPLSAAIPTERVAVPYSIGDVLQAAPKVTDDVDATDVNANLHQVAAALKGNSTSLRSIVDGMNSITGIFDRQREQVHQVAALASEYMQTFNGNREFVFALLNKIDQVVNAYNNASVGFNYTYWLLASALERINPFLRFYRNHTDLIRDYVYKIRDSVLDAKNHLEPMLQSLGAMRSQMAAWITPEGMKQLGGQTLWVNNLCVPIAGRNC
ncbi:MlaD family protein [Gordonia asplenii]|uniref:MlaD family protein n=1 Tax=Gordonia asplenii TaxID=2725283 RepID=UPI0028AD8A9B|nr:MlaD family protein [Gordonia asplenii]